MGQPTSQGLMKILEVPENVKLMNQAELRLHADQKKVELYAQKEELFFAIDEKSHEADLTEKGRNFLSPKDPDAFMLPDLSVALHDIDTGPETDARKRLEAKTKLQQEFETKAQRIHAISQLLKAFCLYQKDVQYVVQDNKVIIVDENTGRPILDGTISVEVSEHLSRMLKREGIIHSVLNAKYHQQEAEIVARAGQRASVTIATNMAGRGTDIKLGAGVPDAGGLHVIGTERHEARRIDRQLRGRCARHCVPGSLHLFISLEDDLMR